MEIDFEAPDRGLVEALRLYPPSNLPGLDLGCYTGRQALAMIPYCSQVVAYDINSHYQAEALALMEKMGLSFKFQAADVLSIEFGKGEIGVVSVGITIYNPKSTVIKFLQKVVTWFPPRGILHVQFTLVGDESEQSPFVQQGCVREDEYEHSYIFYGCGHCFQCFQFGLNGGSFWQEDEADQTILSLDSGGLQILCREPQYFIRPSVGPHDEVGDKELQRAFYNVTAIKK